MVNNVNTKNMERKQLETQLKRLIKNYELSRQKYVHENFLDLLSSLRIWTEIKKDDDITKNAQTIQNPFNSIKRLIKKYNYIHVYFHTPITTTSEATGEKDVRHLFSFPDDQKPFTIGSLAKLESNNNITIYNFTIIHKCLSRKESELMNRELKNMPIQKISLFDYLNSQAIYFNLPNVTQKYISRSHLIKRLANEYDADHIKKDGSSNLFSPIVAELMKYRYATLPLPYFVTLQISQDIIKSAQEQLHKTV